MRLNEQVDSLLSYSCRLHADPNSIATNVRATPVYDNINNWDLAKSLIKCHAKLLSLAARLSCRIPKSEVHLSGKTLIIISTSREVRLGISAFCKALFVCGSLVEEVIPLSRVAVWPPRALVV